MAVVRSRERTRFMTLDVDKDTENPTVFKYKLPSQKFMDEIESEGARHQGSPEKLIPMTRKILRECIVGWEHLVDEEGAPVPFGLDASGKMSDQSLALIIDFKQELLEKLMAAIQMKPRDLEQSPSPT